MECKDRVFGFFFCRQKTAYEMRISDWSSDVCSSDLSMQVYRELHVLTARPGPADMARAPHRLYGVLAGTERCSAARWREMALAEIDEAHAAGRLPIVVG